MRRVPNDVDGVRRGVVAAHPTGCAVARRVAASAPVLVGGAVVAVVAVLVIGIAAVLRPLRVCHDVQGLDTMAMRLSMGTAVRMPLSVRLSLGVDVPERARPVRVRVSRCGGREAGGGDERRHAQRSAAARENGQSSPHLDTTLL